MHADRTNRAVLTIFGLLVLAAGVGGLIASVGGFGRAFSHRAVFDNALGRYFGREGAWLWPVIAIACGLLILLVLRWLVALLLSTDRAGDVVISSDRSRGRTTLRPGAVTDAVTAEIDSYRGVHSSKARVLGDSRQPELVIAVTLDPDADLPALHRRIRQSALDHTRNALGRPDLPIQLDFNVARATTTRTYRAAAGPAGVTAWLGGYPSDCPQTPGSR